MGSHKTQYMRITWGSFPNYITSRKYIGNDRGNYSFTSLIES